MTDSGFVVEKTLAGARRGSVVHIPGCCEVLATFGEVVVVVGCVDNVDKSDLTLQMPRAVIQRPVWVSGVTAVTFVDVSGALSDFGRLVPSYTRVLPLKINSSSTSPGSWG